MNVAAVQLNSSADWQTNLTAADRHVRAAAAAGARLIVLPEKWNAMGAAEELLAQAQELDGPATTWAAEIARELQVDLIAGSILERVAGSERLANTSLHIGADGTIKAAYRKIHMFDVEIEGRHYRESELEQPGEEIVLSESAEGIELGMSICYDLRFPELFRILAMRGARVIVLPSAFTLVTTRAHWETLVRARAIENQAFMIAANQTGVHPGGHHSGGNSMIVDPWGVILARAGEDAGYILAELDLERQLEIRTQLPALANRRPQSYQWPEEAYR